jgi:hypothetical protein
MGANLVSWELWRTARVCRMILMSFTRAETLQVLHQQLLCAQQCMKKQADRNRSE